MRFCPHCRRLNAGRPSLCHYCGRTWQVRLCPRGHENPPDAQYCGTCGSADLTETAGPLPFWIWLVRIGIIIIIIIVILIASISGVEWHLTEQIVVLEAYVIAIIILFIALRLALSQIPVPTKRFINSTLRIVKKVGHVVLGWGWKKLKNLFS